MFNAPREVRRAVARRLWRLSMGLEYLARLGRTWLEPEQLRDLWTMQAAALDLARELGFHEPPARAPDRLPVELD